MTTFEPWHACRLEHGQHALHGSTGLLRRRRPGGSQARWKTTSGARMAASDGELGGEHVERVDLQRAAGGAGVGEVGQRAGGQVVDDVDGVILGEQPIDEVRAEEPGAADDEHVHVASMVGRSSPDADLAGAT